MSNKDSNLEKSGSSLWTSSPDSWVKFESQTDMSIILENNLASLKELPLDVQRRIEVFKTPLKSELLEIYIG